MTLTTAQRFHLKKSVKELESYRGRHTELVTVYVPQGYELNKVINQLQQEQGTADNIKSTSTRKNVVDALERMIQHLKLFKGTPPNGLVVFSGNVAEREGQSDVKVWSIEPPLPLKTRIYRCDKDFQLDILRDMLNIQEVYGLVVMDSRDATIALLKGKTIIPLVKTHSHVPGKFKAGGQSAVRFSRIREIAAQDHYKKVAEYMKESFLGNESIKGILVGGPGPPKYELVEGNFITNEVKKKILGIKDLSYTDEFGLEELLERSKDILSQEEVSEEKKIVTRFLEMLATKEDLTAYGENEVRRTLEAGAVDMLLLSESLSDEKIEEFEAIAKNYGTEIRIVSIETREGIQLKELGKMAAILRYAVYKG